jgi:hypothetical protein
LRKITGTVAVILALALMAGPAAQAHQGNPNFKSEITAIEPADLADGIELSTVNFDDGLELISRSDRVIVVKGYDGEPYLRFDPSGTVEVNLNSPAHYLNQDRFADVEIPERADSEAAPDWRQVDDTGVYSWHDHRSHYMGEGVPPQVVDEAEQAQIFDYRIPLTIDGQPALALGSLTWVGSDDSFPVMPFIGLALIAASGTAFIFVRRNRRGNGPGDERLPEESGSAGSPPAP